MYLISEYLKISVWFNTTQIYTNFARSYKHNKLIIFFLPSNDFGENDYDNWRGIKKISSLL